MIEVNVLAKKEQSQQFKEFEAFEDNVIGPGVHDKLQNLVNKWAKALEYRIFFLERKGKR